MELVDARRLTGPNPLSREPLVIVELGLSDAEKGELDDVVGVYTEELSRMRTALGFEGCVGMKVRERRQGAVVGYEAPVDVMFACAEMSEWAALSACERLAGREALPLEPKLSEVTALLERDRNPRLLALQAESARRGIPLLWDDEHVSLGEGAHSVCWPRASLPEVDEVPWESLGSIPVALVTGTNGKTTCTRLLARIAREAGFSVGSASSDEIAIGGKVTERGDWTGPAAARAVLRRREVELAVLETARGGILRRGLAVPSCDAALITNVTDDHLGNDGVDGLDDMARVKAVVADAVRADGTVVLNAHDERLVALAARLSARVTFFANLDRDDARARAVIAEARARGERCVVAEDGKLFVATGDQIELVVEVTDVPIAFEGAAAYNVENAAACVAVARALGIGKDAIARGLTGFQHADNPRRGELLEVRGVRLLLDFGHNPDGVRAVMQLVGSLRDGRPGRLCVVVGAAGDRSAHEISEMVREIVSARPDRVMVRELAGYLRGRAPGEVPRLFEDALASQGLPLERVTRVGSEVEALCTAFDSAEPGDFVVMLAHLEAGAVHAYLDALT